MHASYHIHTYILSTLLVDGPAVAAPPLHEDVEHKELEPVSDEDGEVIFELIRTTSLECSG